MVSLLALAKKEPMFALYVCPINAGTSELLCNSRVWKRKRPLTWKQLELNHQFLRVAFWASLPIGQRSFCYHWRVKTKLHLHINYNTINTLILNKKCLFKLFNTLSCIWQNEQIGAKYLCHTTSATFAQTLAIFATRPRFSRRKMSPLRWCVLLQSQQHSLPSWSSRWWWYHLKSNETSMNLWISR